MKNNKYKWNNKLKRKIIICKVIQNNQKKNKLKNKEIQMNNWKKIKNKNHKFYNWQTLMKNKKYKLMIKLNN